jgi:hypothetical protein
MLEILIFVLAILTVLVAWFSLVLNMNLGYLRFFRFFPSVKRYYMAIDAINKLEGTKNWTIDKKDSELVINHSVIDSNSSGFKELAEIIKRDKKLDGQITQLKLVISVDFKSYVPRYIKSLMATIGNIENNLVVFDPSDPEKTRVILVEMADKYVRRFIISISGILILLWFLLQTALIFILQK